MQTIRVWIAAAVAAAMIAVPCYSQQPVGVVNGIPMCNGPLGVGPCADVMRYLLAQQQALQDFQLQVIGSQPGIGPICAGPLGPGPCGSIAMYLKSQRDRSAGVVPRGPGAPGPFGSRASPSPFGPFAGQLPQVINQVGGVGAICSGPFGPAPCGMAQQALLDQMNGPVPSQSSFGLPPGLKVQDLAIACAQRARLDVAAFAGCSGQQVILPKNQQAVLDCAVNNRDAKSFAECAAPNLGMKLSADQKTLASCAMKASGDEDEFFSCAGSQWAGRNLNADQKAVLSCAKDADDATHFATCAGTKLLGNHATKEQKVALRCAAESDGDVTNVAVCIGANMVSLQLNPEQQIAVQCVVSTGGQPYAAAGCMASRLTARELTKCFTSGFGGSDGCFGDNNDLVGKNGWTARTMGQIAGGPNSVVNNPGQIWGGDNSFVRNPAQIWGGPNSFVRNPSQIWGGSNSIFNNPGQLLPQAPPALQLGTVGGKRICLPWC